MTGLYSQTVRIPHVCMKIRCNVSNRTCTVLEFTVNWKQQQLSLHSGLIELVNSIKFITALLLSNDSIYLLKVNLQRPV